jgi:uncharacterized membrane protein
LFMVTLTPFPTAILAEFIQTEGRTALLIFGFNYIMIGFGAYSICRYAYKNFLVEESNRSYFYFIEKTYFYSIFYTILVFFIGFFSISAAIALYLFMFGVFAFPNNFATFLYNRKQRKMKITKDQLEEQSQT